MSSERAYIRTESLSCVTRDGTAIDVPVKGLRGRRGRQGRHARTPGLQAGADPRNALLAGVASGIGHAFTQAHHVVGPPLGTTSTVDPGNSWKPVWAPASARRWTGSLPSTTSASPRRSSR